MAKLTPPTADYLEALRTEMEDAYRDDDAQIQRTREVRDLRRPVVLPDVYHLVDVEVRDPTIADEVQRVVATLTINPATLTVTPSRPSDKAEENATLRKHFTEQVLRVAGSRVPGIHTEQAAVDGCVGDGGGWTKLLFTKDRWDERFKKIKRKDYDDDPADSSESTETDETAKERKPKRRSGAQKYVEATEEAKKSAGPPFTWLCVDAATIYPVWQGSELGEVLEVTERPLSATFRKYRLGKDANGKIVSEELGQGTSTSGNAQTVLFLEHWDAVHCTYYVMDKGNSGNASGKIVQQWEHKYQRVPYFWAPGAGFRNYWRGRKVGWGVSESKRWLVEYRGFLQTLLAQVAARDAMPPVIRELPADASPVTGDDGQPRARETWHPGEIITLRPGEKMTPMQFFAVSQALLEQLKITDEAIAKLETPRFSGPIGDMSGAGFAVNQVLTEARTRHQPICQAIEDMLTEVTRFLWHLIRVKVKDTVWVYSESEEDSGWLGAGPDDLGDGVNIAWKLDPELPSSKLIEERYWAERVKNGSASLDQMILALGDNPDEVRFGREMDRLRQTPWYQQFLDLKTLQGMGKGEMAVQAARALQIAQTGQMPQLGPGTPPAMGGAGVVPDMGNLAMAPNGAGAAPIQTNSPTLATSPGAVVPERSATPGAQAIVR